MERQRNKKKRMYRRWVVFAVLVFFAVQLVVPLTLVPREAKALFGVGDVSVTIGDIPRLFMDALYSAVKTAADVAFRNMIRGYLNDMAVYYANKIATGEAGQKPMFMPNPEKFFLDIGDAAAGDFLDNLARSALKGKCAGYPDMKCQIDPDCPPVTLYCPDDPNIKVELCGSRVEEKNRCISAGCYEVPEFGIPPPGVVMTSGAPECLSSFSLCKPQNITTEINMNLWARQSVYGNLTPRCPLSAIIDNIEATSQQRLIEVSTSFNPEATDFGGFLSIQGEAFEAAIESKEGLEFRKSFEGEIEPPTTTISGDKATPGVFVERTQTTLLDQSFSQIRHQTGSMIADVIGTFTNTLGSKLLEQALDPKKGYNPAVSSRTPGIFSDILRGSTPGTTAARELFATLEEVNYTPGGQVDVLSKLASCPDPNEPTPDTCVIDTRFRTAIDQRLTVREALDQGLLDGTRSFGFNSNGSEPEYYNGYPYRSLVILRKYRVIPVGWELAAKFNRDYLSGNYSLNTVIGEYNNEGSPFYKLIDPNWVLKLPEVFCKSQGAGPKIQSSTVIRTEDTNNDAFVNTFDAASYLIQRQSDYCADEQQCLRENEDGSCKKYGYCIEEKPVWKFQGTACESYYDTCESLARRDGQQAFYLTNTVDINGCNANNAGCGWYCTDYVNATGQWSCANQAPTDRYPMISYNMHAEECSQTAEGCSQLMNVAGPGVNLLRNSGFEEFVASGASPLLTDGIRDIGQTPADAGTSEPDTFPYWEHDMIAGGAPCGNRKLAVTTAFSGSTAARIHSYGTSCGADPGYYSMQVVDTGHLTDGRTFTASFHARTSDDASCAAGGSLDVVLRRLINEPAIVFDYSNNASLSIDSQWTRYTVALSFDALPQSSWAGPDISKLQREIHFLLQHDPTDACDIIIDNVQLEEGGTLTAYRSYENSSPTYLKKPPEYLGCTGNPVTDDRACDDFALICSADEVGCNAYTAASTGDVVNGTITSPRVCDPLNPSSCDQCPAEYVGCQAFREMPIERTPRRPVRDPVSFVSGTGNSCPATAEGCEEYTNLDEVAAGGEGREYYSYIRMCVEETDPSAETFYTWEASEEFGFQLRQYDLKVSNTGSGNPCTNIAPENPALAGIYQWPNCVDDETFDENSDGIDEAHDAQDCSDTCGVGFSCTNNPTVTCSTDQDCNDYAVQSDPDCTEFYDDTGGKHYVRKSYVVYASDQCNVYRNSNDPDDVLYHMVPGEGISCNASYAGCRSYKGNAGNNSRNVYREDFEDGTTGEWLGSSISNSNESLVFGGHSLLVPSQAYLPAPLEDSTEMREGFSYTISFWAKGAVANTAIGAYVTIGATTYQFTGESIARTGDWNRFKLGPLYVDPGSGIPQLYELYLDSTNAFYVDNIKIDEVYDSIYYIKDTYTECSGYENCDQYTDRANNVHYLKSFSRMCSEDKVGCEALIDTQNSTGPDVRIAHLSSTPLVDALNNQIERGDVNGDGARNVADETILLNYTYTDRNNLPPVVDAADVNADGTINEEDYYYLYNFLNSAGPTPTPAETYPSIVVPADTTITLVDDPRKGCVAGDKGCMRLGDPTIDMDGNLSFYTDVYLKNNPDLYDNILCDYNHNMCEEYTTSGGSKLYFKDPGAQVCEYKRVVGQDVSGWYQVDTESGAPDCPVSDGICIGGGNPGQVCNVGTVPTRCGGGVCEERINLVQRPVNDWVGLCTETADGCTEYRDPEEPSECDVTLEDGAGLLTEDCESYYYVDTTVDQSSCNGLVSRDEGCRLFNNTAGGELVYDSSASENGEPPELCANPADCDSNTIVKVRKDRECAKWLDCKMSETKTTDAGQVDTLCLERQICGSMDPDTGHCTSKVPFEFVNQTYSTPSFVDRVQNFSGYVLAGLEWGERCINDPLQICTADTDCPDDASGNIMVGSCAIQLEHGYLPYAAMQEVGSVSIGGEIVENGDMGDRDYEANRFLSFALSYVDVSGVSTFREISEVDLSGSSPWNPITSPPPPPPPYSSVWPVDWYPRGNASVYMTEEDENGLIPSQKNNLDENNVLHVDPRGSWAGAYYDAGTDINRGEEYSLSFKLRSQVMPIDGDRIIVMLEYVDENGVNVNNTGYTEITRFRPSTTWEEYTFSDILAGFDNSDPANPIEYAEVRLIFVYKYDLLPITDGIPIDFFLDDVSMSPVLRANYDKRCRGGIDDGKMCENNNDCAGAGVCFDGTLLQRSCRLYPSADAPYCEYVDENNTTHRGWKGYCIEPDPGNSNYCINWWPVDLLKGESSSLSSLPQMIYSGRRPLYMCLQAEGNEEPAWTGDYYYASQNLTSNCPGDPTCGDIPGESYQIISPWFNMIMEGGYEKCGTGGPCDMSDRCNNCGNWPCCVDQWNLATTDITEENIEQVYIYEWGGDSQWHGILPIFNKAIAISTTDCPPGAGVGTCSVNSTIDRVVNGGQIVWRLYPDTGGGHCPDRDGDGQCLWMEFRFDQTTKVLEQVRALGEDSTGTDDEPGAFKLGIILREPCTFLAQVAGTDPDEVKPWSQRASSNSDYPVDGLLYGYDDDYAPFGGVANKENTTPDTWRDGNNHALIHFVEAGQWNVNPLIPGPTGHPRARWPYSCLGSCGTRRCSTDITNDCSNNTNIISCQNNNNGKCIGVGPVALDDDGEYDDVGGGVVGDDYLMNQAVDRTMRLFADVNGVWEFNYGYNINYGLYDAGTGDVQNIRNYWSYGPTGYSQMSQCPGNDRPLDFASEYCGVVPKVTVVAGIGGNMQPNEHYISLGSGGGDVQLNITIDANPEQLPIRLLEVDWDEVGTPNLIMTGSFGPGTVSYSNNYTVPGEHFIKVKVVDNWDWCGIQKGDNIDCNATDCRFYADLLNNDDCDSEIFETNIRIFVSS